MDSSTTFRGYHHNTYHLLQLLILYTILQGVIGKWESKQDPTSKQMLDWEANAKRGSIYPRLIFYDLAVLAGGNLKVHRAPP